MTSLTSSSSNADWAQAYARRGWPVVPLWWPAVNRPCACPQLDCGTVNPTTGQIIGSPAKHPIATLVRHGLNDASDNPEVITRWWTRYPQANVGLVTGVAFDVLDVDGAAGEAALRAARGNRTEPAGPVARTGGGGRHVLVSPTGLGNRAGVVDHVDWRGRGGYIVAPPSIHTSRRPYQWEVSPSDRSLGRCPGWLTNLLNPSPPCRAEVLLADDGWIARCRGCRWHTDAHPRPIAVQEAQRHSQRGRPATGNSTPSDRYVSVAVESAVRDVSTAVEGTRNNKLNAAAYGLYRLVGGGLLDEDAATEVLATAATAAGLAEAEIARTLASARRAGFTTPKRP